MSTLTHREGSGRFLKCFEKNEKNYGVCVLSYQSRFFLFLFSRCSLTFGRLTFLEVDDGLRLISLEGRLELLGRESPEGFLGLSCMFGLDCEGLVTEGGLLGLSGLECEGLVTEGGLFGGSGLWLLGLWWGGL